MIAGRFNRLRPIGRQAAFRRQDQPLVRSQPQRRAIREITERQGTVGKSTPSANPIAVPAAAPARTDRRVVGARAVSCTEPLGPSNRRRLRARAATVVRRGPGGTGRGFSRSAVLSRNIGSVTVTRIGAARHRHRTVSEPIRDRPPATSASAKPRPKVALRYEEVTWPIPLLRRRAGSSGARHPPAHPSRTLGCPG